LCAGVAGLVCQLLLNNSSNPDLLEIEYKKEHIIKLNKALLSGNSALKEMQLHVIVIA
jgi:hypothetical protein